MAFRRRVILNILRQLLAVMAFLFVVIGILFYSNNTYINELDNYIVKKFTTRYSDRLEQAKSLLPHDRKKSIQILKALLEDLEPVKIMDRLAPIKHNSFELISNLLREQDDMLGALYYVNRWTEFNKNDLTAQAIKGELLLSFNERRKEGEAILEELFVKVPETEVAVNAYIAMLLDQTKIVEAFLAFSKHVKLRQNYLKGEWRIYWELENGFSAKNSKKIIPTIRNNGRLALTFDLDSKTKRLRIDPPPFSKLSIRNPKFVIRDNKKETVLDLAKYPIQFNQMSGAGTTFATTGSNDPYFYWRMPERWDKKIVEVVFDAYVSPLVPEKMREIALSPKADSIANDLLARKKIVALDLLNRIRQDAVEKTKIDLERDSQSKMDSIAEIPMVLYWIYGEEKFSEQHKSQTLLDIKTTGKKNQFNVMWPVGSDVSQLRIDLPDVRWVGYSFRKLELIYGSQRKAIDINKETLVLQHNIERRGDLFKVTGEDPHFSFIIPPLESKLDFVHLEGEVR